MALGVWCTHLLLGRDETIRDVSLASSPCSLPPSVPRPYMTSLYYDGGMGYGRSASDASSEPRLVLALCGDDSSLSWRPLA